MSIATLALAFVAGVLSILSPCVLPLVPIVLATAASTHRFGPAALAAGLALSFTLLGLFVATIGFSIGLDAEWFRKAGAIILLALAGVLLLPALQARVTIAAGPVSNYFEQRLGGFSTEGASGQFALGALLGAVWAPCVGPTLGAAALLASQGKDLPHVALTMLAFGLGAAMPLLLLGTLSRGEAMQRWRGRLLGAGGYGKAVLGAVLAALGLMVLTGLDKSVEAILVEASPAWLTELTVSY